jgi:hypothetical protein
MTWVVILCVPAVFALWAFAIINFYVFIILFAATIALGVWVKRQTARSIRENTAKTETTD